jgi:ubiquinone/menaquinone biosynthesis C-methylase UbiE
MSKQPSEEYLLGTHDAELARLGIQHRVWRPFVLDCWRRAGITIGTSVLDIGAGPGFATLDLAEIVGPTGRVIALERSSRFLTAAQQMCTLRNLTNVEFHEMDLMKDRVPVTGMDVAWCRWITCFVSSPRVLVEKIAGSIRSGGTALFHEYLDYASWQMLPQCPRFAEFVSRVMDRWRASGCEPNIAPSLVKLLNDNGFVVGSAVPRVFCIRPDDYMWQWPASFVHVHLDRMRELRTADSTWIDHVRREFDGAQQNPPSLMVTPMVLEIVAQRQ